MKKILLILLVLVISVAMIACGEKSVSNSSQNTDMPTITAEVTNIPTQKPEKLPIEESTKSPTEAPKEVPTTEPINVKSLEELEELVEKDVEKTISELTKDFEELVNTIDTYESYKANIDTIEMFYEKIFINTHALTNRLKIYTLYYAEIIFSADNSIDDKYENMEEIYDVIYDNAGDDIYDEIYDGILDDMYDSFYDGILDDAKNSVEYYEWSDLRSDEYDLWSDTRSDVYDDWSDTRSDIYDFWSDTRGELWDEDIEKAIKEIERFKADVAKQK
ncbi:MAG: hypothetical protein E7387_06060 [Ruminococcaceae bacterium]|nr:hypothetical protein [Oscillospiraceae bacterium]